jgi:uncharacterized protein YndB with AHSA1/START domain
MGCRWPSVALAAVIALAACNTSTEYPPGLEPLEDNTAPDPPGIDQLVVVRGDTPDFAFAHGRGWIAAPTGAVWAALKDPEVVVSWRQTDRHQATPMPDPMYELRFELHYEVDNVITVSWDEDWRYGTVVGTPEAPELALVRYQKVYGTVYIDLLEGELEVTPVDDGTTELAMIEHVKASEGGSAEIATTMNDRFASVLAHVRGLPLPR